MTKKEKQEDLARLTSKLIIEMTYAYETLMQTQDQWRRVMGIVGAILDIDPENWHGQMAADQVKYFTRGLSYLRYHEREKSQKCRECTKWGPIPEEKKESEVTD